MREEKSTKRRELLILVLLIAVLTANVVFWGSRKEGCHVDEMFSYGQIGNTSVFRLWFDQPGQPYLNQWHDISYYVDFHTVDDEEAFDLAGAWNTAYDNDAHPPLYFVALELVTSLFYRNTLTKWSGLVTNLPFYVLALVLLYLTARRLFGGRVFLSLAATAVFGISTGAVSLAVYSRMYMMGVFFTALLLYGHSRLSVDLLSPDAPGRPWPAYVWICLALIGGLLTQYYFLVFAFFLCFLFWLTLILARRWKQAAAYAGLAAGSVLAGAAVCPNFLFDTLKSHRGAEAVSNAAKTTGWFDRSHAFFGIINTHLLGSVGFAAGILLLLLLLAKWGKRVQAMSLSAGEEGPVFRIQLKEIIPPDTRKSCVTLKVVSLFSVTVFLASLLYVMTISLVAPFWNLRYLFAAIPGLALSICYGLNRLLAAAGFSPRVRSLAAAALILLELIGYLGSGVEYLYRGTEEQLRILDGFGAKRAIVITDIDSDCSNLVLYLLMVSSVYQTRVRDISML